MEDDGIRVISICLELWVGIYEGTKTEFHIKAGPQDEVFLWMYMYQAANDANVPEEGWAGGLIHDETKIQQDLVLDMRGGKLHLVGWVDTGVEGNDLRTVELGKS
ncbi:hypothetical protein ACJMK2_036671 [Sinanodonta woodiana]|uniref:Uncharacterized protein n=1 Tax=Sinanodonta woodiana TaxID=1069815 RepID=A0ABD3WHY2_SINWO